MSNPHFYQLTLQIDKIGQLYIHFFNEKLRKCHYPKKDDKKGIYQILLFYSLWILLSLV